MHLKKNISKIPFWLYYYLQDFWIRCKLKSINSQNHKLEKAEKILQKRMLRYCLRAFPEYCKKIGVNEKAVLQDFPLLNKDILRANPVLFQSRYKNRLSINTFSTSGSTGNPFAFEITPNHDPVHQRMLWNLMGYETGDKIVLVNGDTLSEANLSKNIYYKVLSPTQLPYGGYSLSSMYLSQSTVQYYFDFIDEIQPAFIRGYSHAIYRLAQYAEKLNKSFDFKIKGIQLTSEMVFDYQIELIERVFSTKVCMQYGHSEACVFAYTTPGDRRYRCSPLYGHVEVLNEQGVHVREGERGEVVVTSYSNYAMPFVRYQTGDIAEYGGIENGIVILNTVEGRMQEFIYTKNGEKRTRVGLVTKLAYSHMLKWKLIQYEYGKLIFQIVKGPEYSWRDEEEIRTVYEKNGEFKVDFEYVEDIPLSKRGKAVLVEQHIES